jgi:hypothetical protein
MLEGNTKMDLKEMGCGMRSSGQDRVQWRALVNTALRRLVP